MQQPRGLQNFISDLRNAPSKAAEGMRVEKELANIRKKFAQSGTLDSYSRKKYVWKLCYIFMLGYEVDFGHMEVIYLLASPKFSEKGVGYMAVSLLMKPEDDIMTLVVNSIRNDIISGNPDFQSLALAAIANIGGDNFAETLADDMHRLLTAPETHPLIKKKAALCSLRLFRANPHSLDAAASAWPKRVNTLLESRHLGVLTSAASLLLSLASHSAEGYAICVPYVILTLGRLILGRTCPPDYLYYSTPSPWLQVKLLRFLQYYRAPESPETASTLNDVLDMTLKINMSESVNKSNADHSILFEAVNLIISYGTTAAAPLRTKALKLLGRFIGQKDPNIRYLGLVSLSRLAKNEGPGMIQEHQQTVFNTLRDADISVRKRALDVLFVMCDQTNGVAVVTELLTHLAVADSNIKEEMVLKIAILAEKYAEDLRWYVDSMVEVMALAGDYVSEAIWHRIAQIVTNNQDLQAYAAEKLFDVVSAKRLHESSICLGAYILGEYGFLVAEEPGKSGPEQFNALIHHFNDASLRAKAVMMTAVVKLGNTFDDVTAMANAHLEKYTTSTHLELQMRSCEYLEIVQMDAGLKEDVLREMPAYKLDGVNRLEERIKAKELATHDRNVWAEGGGDNKPQPKSEERVAPPPPNAYDSRYDTNTSYGSTSGGGSEYGSTVDGRPPASSYAAYESRAGGADNFRSQAPSSSPSSAYASSAAAPYSSSSPSASSSLASTRPSSAGASASNSSNTDLFDADSSALPPTPPSSSVRRLTSEENKKMNAAVINMIGGEGGSLMRTEAVHIQVQHAYQLHQARVAIRLTNVSPSVTVNDVSITMKEHPALVFKIGQMPQSMPPTQFAQVTIGMEAMAPFELPPMMRLSFTTDNGVRHEYDLRLPVTNLVFTDNVTMDGPTFMSRWKALEGDKVSMETFASASHVDAARVATLRRMLTENKLKFSICPGLDKTNMTVTACGTMRTGRLGPDGQTKQSVGVLLRLEADAGANTLKLTVKGVHPLVAKGVFNAIKPHLIS